ncbi:hypothetical protein R6Q59_013170 [Mikania micrantha]
MGYNTIQFITPAINIHSFQFIEIVQESVMLVGEQKKGLKRLLIQDSACDLFSHDHPLTLTHFQK